MRKSNKQTKLTLVGGAFVCAYVHVSGCVPAFLCTRKSVCLRLCLCVPLQSRVCIRVYMFACTCTCVHVCVSAAHQPRRTLLAACSVLTHNLPSMCRQFVRLAKPRMVGFSTRSVLVADCVTAFVSAVTPGLSHTATLCQQRLDAACAAAATVFKKPLLGNR